MVLVLCDKQDNGCCRLCSTLAARGIEVTKAASDAQAVKELRRIGGKAQMIFIIGAYSQLAREWPRTDKLRHESFNRLGIVAIEVK